MRGNIFWKMILLLATPAFILGVGSIAFNVMAKQMESPLKDISLGIGQASRLLSITLLLLCTGMLIGGVWFDVKRSKKVEKENLEYRNSLFFYLKTILSKIESEIEDETIKKFKKISNEILDTVIGKYSLENMRFFDEYAYHEINALKEINDSLDNNISITNSVILVALEKVNEGLQIHYEEFCKSKTIGVKEEIIILEKLKNNAQ